MKAGNSISDKLTAGRAVGSSRLLRALGTGLLLLLPIVPLLASAQGEPTEYDVKAAYLYNFAKFVKWPKPKEDVSQFTICIMGDDPFGGTLQSMVAGEKIAGKPVNVDHIQSSRGTSQCNILFISRSETGRVPEILRHVAHSGALTVSDIPEFVNHGGMIEFINQSGRIRFDINLAAAQHAGLNLSSELLKVANSVEGKP